MPPGHYHNKTIERINDTARTDFDPDVLGNANGDGSYIYPGAQGPISSVRFEALRDGLEDWELLDTLQQLQGDAPPMDLIRSVIRSPADRTRDAAPVEAARAEAVRRIGRFQRGERRPC